MQHTIHACDCMVNYHVYIRLAVQILAVLMMEQIDMACAALNSINAKWNLAYYHNSALTPKG